MSDSDRLRPPSWSLRQPEDKRAGPGRRRPDPAWHRGMTLSEVACLQVPGTAGAREAHRDFRAPGLPFPMPQRQCHGDRDLGRLKLVTRRGRAESRSPAEAATRIRFDTRAREARGPPACERRRRSPANATLMMPLMDHPAGRPDILGRRGLVSRQRG